MTEPTTSGISRRTLAKGAAWAVPAVAVAAAAPARAASGGPPRVTVLDACKQPGNSCNTGQRPFGFVKGYTFTVRIDNPTTEDIYIYTNEDNTPGPYFNVTSSVPFSYESARLFTPGSPGTIGAPVGDSLLIPAGGTVYIIINAGTNSNSANTDAIGTLWFPWGHTPVAGSDFDHPYIPAPPAPNPGEGWVGDDFFFASTPPCGTDCMPGGDETAELNGAAVETEMTEASLDEASVVEEASVAGTPAAESPAAEAPAAEAPAAAVPPADTTPAPVVAEAAAPAAVSESPTPTPTPTPEADVKG